MDVALPSLVSHIVLHLLLLDHIFCWLYVRPAAMEWPTVLHSRWINPADQEAPGTLCAPCGHVVSTHHWLPQKCDDLVYCQPLTRWAFECICPVVWVSPFLYKNVSEITALSFRLSIPNPCVKVVAQSVINVNGWTNSTRSSMLYESTHWHTNRASNRDSAARQPTLVVAKTAMASTDGAEACKTEAREGQDSGGWRQCFPAD